MVAGASVNGHGAEKRMKQFNVTDLTSRQKRMLFIRWFSEGGLVAFNKRRVGNQTYYVFIYYSVEGY
jgi:hypothetical protein